MTAKKKPTTRKPSRRKLAVNTELEPVTNPYTMLDDFSEIGKQFVKIGEALQNEKTTVRELCALTLPLGFTIRVGLVKRGTK